MMELADGMMRSWSCQGCQPGRQEPPTHPVLVDGYMSITVSLRVMTFESCRCFDVETNLMTMQTVCAHREF
jgi:hypothetical protein